MQWPIQHSAMLHARHHSEAVNRMIVLCNGNGSEAFSPRRKFITVLLRLVAPARFAKRVVTVGLADVAEQTGGMALVAAAIRQARRQAVQQSARSKFVICD